MGQFTSFWLSVLGFSVFKLFFINSYRSTDFEVHRNWLAITKSLPIGQWYFEETSEWTLDYPPFFAYFEWMLSHVASWVDPCMVSITNLNHASKAAVLFQKSTVVISDLVLALSLKLYIDTTSPGRPRKNLAMILLILIFMNAGLFIVDQIHFQYNGFLFGVLLLSIGHILQQRFYLGAFLFAILLNLKHIFLYMAPAFGIYLFTKCCLRKGKIPIRGQELLNLGLIVVSVTVLSFGPFYNHIPQILSRLFPFKRGLSHAYWAPNVWAIYNTVDLALSLITGKKKSSLTGGLVGEHPLAVLPQVEPIHTFVLTIIFMMPCLYEIWKNPNGRTFVRGVILTSWTSFMFGYHVHEKAILNVIIPFGLIGVSEPELFLITLTSGTVSLFPLLFTPFENITKILVTAAQLALILKYVIPNPKFKWYETVYLVGLIPINLVELISSKLLPNYAFLPLICMSDYTFIGLFYSYVNFYLRYTRRKLKK